MTTGKQDALHEDRQSLWLLTASPAIWMAHFVISYGVAAIWCGKLGAVELGPLRAGIIGSAVIALIAIGIIGLSGWRKHKHGSGDPPHDQDTPEDRHRFLGFATVLLSSMSAIATIYVAMSTLFIPGCD
jgi:hypothetical protein